MKLNQRKVKQTNHWLGTIHMSKANKVKTWVDFFK
uniref:Uncharacterized protein n=1 Tax=Rhizophora mucronata TaxID=61149 RepID=A0A2P2PPK8_RHIMU